MRIAETDLPLELTATAAVEAAYPAELARCQASIARRLPTLIECDKELVAYFYKALRDRLKATHVRCVYLDGRPPPDEGAVPQSIVATMIGQIRDTVRGAVLGDRVLVLPHLDLLVSGSGGGGILTTEAREVIPLMYENPELLWVGFKDPSFPLPKVIANLFPTHVSIVGVPRDRLGHLVTQRESRKFAPKGVGLDVYALYKNVSGVNAVRLRRMLQSIDGEDYPNDASRALLQIRSATLGPSLHVPEVDLDRDIGGYAKVKDRLRKEILEVLAQRDAREDPAEVARMESLLPRGMIFWGPPGTGKTLFAKAMATSLGAAVTVVSGPELKSKWVGESEENLRQIFIQARQSAPAVIIFDELDSFAAARGTYTGSGVEHSMVNQLLTEMDGFRKDELVFVVGTTNFVESLDPALLRPGRFEFHLHIPYPNELDRSAILEIHNRKLALQLSARALAYAVKRTGDRLEGQAAQVGEGRYSGDHIQALCRQMARRRLRDQAAGPSEVEDVERAISEYAERPALTSGEERVIATHESGHAICALFCPHAPPIERISIRGDIAGTLGFVQYDNPAHKYVVTRKQLLDTICVLFGGREAEALLLDDLSIGSAHDLERATAIARELVEQLGLGAGAGEAEDLLGVQRFAKDRTHGMGTTVLELSDVTRAKLETRVGEILAIERKRAQQILVEQRPLLESLRDLLLEKKVLDRESIATLTHVSSDKPTDESAD